MKILLDVPERVYRLYELYAVLEGKKVEDEIAEDFRRSVLGIAEVLFSDLSNVLSTDRIRAEVIS